MKVIWIKNKEVFVGELDDSLKEKLTDFCIMNKLKALSWEELSRYDNVIRMIKQTEGIETLPPIIIPESKTRKSWEFWK